MENSAFMHNYTVSGPKSKIINSYDLLGLRLVFSDNFTSKNI